MTNVEQRHITVIGAARSGIAVASLLKKKGARVFVTDGSPIAGEIKSRLEKERIPFEEGGHTEKAARAEMVVPSPGVPDDNPVMKAYTESGRPVCSELEVASWFNKSPLVAVTGSNGKTTVVNWLNHTWETAGRPALTAGNIGDAFSARVNLTRPDITVILEVSSFQLDHIDRFRPDVGILLNITPDHLDRYNYDFDTYARSKFRITENQKAEDRFIYNYEDPVIAGRAETLSEDSAAPHLYAFSDRREVPEGVFVRDEHIVFKFNQREEPLMPIGEVGLPGRHNLNNGLATALAARVSEIKNEAIRESLRTFEGVEHRLETVRTLDGVRYVNDSKATNVNAVWYALDSFSEPMVLILGGRDKGNDYTSLAGLIREKVHTVVAIGEARPGIRKQLSGTVPHFMEAKSMEEAVSISRKAAKRGEIVLLSPACSSFDMFENYEHRGDRFREAVNEL